MKMRQVEEEPNYQAFKYVSGLGKRLIAGECSRTDKIVVGGSAATVIAGIALTAMERTKNNMLNMIKGDVIKKPSDISNWFKNRTLLQRIMCKNEYYEENGELIAANIASSNVLAAG